MDLQPHPTFGTWFQRAFLRAWILPAVLFAVSLISLKSGFAVIGWTSAASFGAALLGTLGYFHHRLFHVACPRCGEATRTAKDVRRRRWLAHCESCRTAWDLGIGITARVM